MLVAIVLELTGLMEFSNNETPQFSRDKILRHAKETTLLSFTQDRLLE